MRRSWRSAHSLARRRSAISNARPFGGRREADASLDRAYGPKREQSRDKRQRGEVGHKSLSPDNCPELKLAIRNHSAKAARHSIASFKIARIDRGGDGSQGH